MNGQRLGRLLPTGGLLVLVALFGAGGCGDDDGAETPTPQEISTSVNPSPTTARPTAMPSLEDEVLAAYADYWEVYAQALRDRDASRLDEVMTGARLDRAIAEVEDLRNQGQAVALVVSSRPVVVGIERDHAFVLDEYENQTHLIDPESKSPLKPTPIPGATLRDRVTLQRVGETWKVMETVRQVTTQ